MSPDRASPAALAPRRRVLIPAVLFVATCGSTFWAAATHWHPELLLLGSVDPAVLLQGDNLRLGLIYMAAVIGILLAHEMGHFLQTLRHRIPASLPLFIPIPLNPFGTMGAVIGMEGLRADRRQLFDIGISGPLAGLVLAVPISVLGLQQLDPRAPATPSDPRVAYAMLHNPLLFDLLLPSLNPQFAATHADGIALAQVNPLLMAGWVGLLVTGLNMLPISQLDGGHVVYALFGRRSRIIAGGFLTAAIAYIVVADAHIWSMMLILVILIGVHHPPTANDRVRLGPLRWLVGIASLVIPILCFPPHGITIRGG
jgi:membrane-associated protease RseP (regulator of RpoE activity)